MEEKRIIRELEVTAIDIPEMRQRKDEEYKIMKKFYNIYKGLNIHVTGIPKGDEEQKKFEEIAVKFSKWDAVGKLTRWSQSGSIYPTLSCLFAPCSVNYDFVFLFKSSWDHL